MPKFGGIYLSNRHQVLVELSEEEEERIEAIVRSQVFPKVAANIHSNRIDPNKSEFGAVHIGARPKFAAAILLGTVWAPKPRMSGKLPMEPDFVMPDGRTVQVRYRDKNHYDFALNTTNLEDFTTDIGILALPYDGKIFRLAGWTTKEEFIAKHYLAPWRHGDRCAIYQADLFSMDLLVSGDYS